MERESHGGLSRLRQLIRARPVAAWIEKTKIGRGTGGRPRLVVPGPFAKEWLETRCRKELKEAFAGGVEIVAERARPADASAEILPQGPQNEIAAKMIRAFVAGELPSSPLLVLYGPQGSGKSLLLAYASRLARGLDFRLDVSRLLRGASRNLLPRKPILLADEGERLEGKAGAQRILCSILDAVTDRGGRSILSFRGHPAKLDLSPALRARVLGGVLLPVDPPTADQVRARLRAVARERGRRLERAAEERLSRLPPEEAIRCLEAHLEGRIEAPEGDPVGRIKDFAANAFRVPRERFDEETKRRSVVEARRFAMGVLCRCGFPAARIAKAFSLRSARTVREACAWLKAREERDAAFAGLVEEAARVVPAG